MKCPICGDEVNEIKPRDGHLVVGKNFADGHIHIHGDLGNKSLMQECIETAGHEVGITMQPGQLNRKEFVFHNRQRIGDMLMFTCAIRDFKAAFPDTRVNVISTAPHIWDHNPNIDRSLVVAPDAIIKIGPGKLTNSSNRLDWHFANAYRVSIEDALGVRIPQGESRPDIWFTKEEYNAPRVIKDPYWLIVVNGEKGWGSKMYPFDRWQEFVNQNPDQLFVQLGTKEDNPPRLQGKNALDYVGQTQSGDTGIRDLFKLFLNAEGSIGLVSFHMHLSGALYKPAIVVAGAREPVSFTRYAGHQYLATDGCLPCAVTACWHCDINACSKLVVGKEKVPACVDMIYPEDLTRALNQYYRGGRLVKGQISAKPKLKNVVETPVVVPVEKTDPGKYGLEWGGGCITSNDWDFMKFVFQKYEIKTVLEFGSGLSTLLMNDVGLKVKTYETNQGWIDKLKGIKPEIDIELWDGKTDFPRGSYDLAFVDGPAGGWSRDLSTKIGAESARVVLVHDANREFERQWQEKYLQAGFEGPGKGGNRCHLWVKDPKKAQKQADLSIQEPPRAAISSLGSKYIKIVSTARGWGGCARSVTTIIKFLLHAGHKVEFIPFRNKVSSKEFKECIRTSLPGLIVTENYDTIREACDILFMYADDYVWEFGQPEVINTFSELSASRKIMMVNYRRGDVGKLPWTQGWDKYMFLNSTQECELLKVLPGVKTNVLPPCTELAEFFKVQPNYNNNLRIVRHNSQGDTKFYPDFSTAIGQVLASRPDVEIAMIPGPSFVKEAPRFRKFPRTASAQEIAAFLGTGNLFWYSLPIGYMDMGPRVILEAMAAGLPILADNWGGAVDRVTPECGWLCNTKEEHAAIIKNLTFEELKKKGQAARERAQTEFAPEKWIEEILVR